MIRTAVTACLIALPMFAAAHAPVLDDGQFAKTKTAPFLIDDPEHSKAIYSELSGAPHFYRLDSDKPFNFYLGITAPKIEGCTLGETFSFEVLNAEFEKTDGRDGAGLDWTPWYEKFGKKWYWVGPQIGTDFKSDRVYPAGTYHIKVFNAANSGKYVLATGDVERFGAATLLTIRSTMKRINEKFWNPANCNS